VFNLCRPEIFSVRDVATRLGERLGRAPIFERTEAATALLGNAGKITKVMGTPAIPLETMVRWVAGWVKRDGRSLGKPTHFEVRDGSY
jgi:hypothetical protein